MGVILHNDEQKKYSGFNYIFLHPLFFFSSQLQIVAYRYILIYLLIFFGIIDYTWKRNWLLNVISNVSQVHHRKRIVDAIYHLIANMYVNI